MAKEAKKSALDEKIEATDKTYRELMNQYSKDQREIEASPLWKQLGVSYADFLTESKKRREELKKDPVWQQKFNDALAACMTKAKEASGNYEKTNFAAMRGIKI